MPTNYTTHGPCTLRFNHTLPTSCTWPLKKHCTHTVKSKRYNHMFEHKRADFHLLPGILSKQTSYPIIGMSRSAIKHRLSPLSFLVCIRRKLRLPIYQPNTRCICGHHDHDVFGDHAFCCDCRTRSWGPGYILLVFIGG